MFTVLCWLFLATFPSVFGCWFAGKTRNTKEACYGDSKPIPPGLTRAANVPEDTLVCLRHCRVIERQDSRCSSPFQGQHSNAVFTLGIYRGNHLLTKPWYIFTVFILAEITEVNLSSRTITIKSANSKIHA